MASKSKEKKYCSLSGTKKALVKAWEAPCVGNYIKVNKQGRTFFYAAKSEKNRLPLEKMSVDIFFFKVQAFIKIKHLGIIYCNFKMR